MYSGYFCKKCKNIPIIKMMLIKDYKLKYILKCKCNMKILTAEQINKFYYSENIDKKVIRNKKEISENNDLLIEELKSNIDIVKQNNETLLFLKSKIIEYINLKIKDLEKICCKIQKINKNYIHFAEILKNAYETFPSNYSNLMNINNIFNEEERFSYCEDDELEFKEEKYYNEEEAEEEEIGIFRGRRGRGIGGPRGRGRPGGRDEGPTAYKIKFGKGYKIHIGLGGRRFLCKNSEELTEEKEEYEEEVDKWALKEKSKYLRRPFCGRLLHNYIQNNIKDKVKKEKFLMKFDKNMCLSDIKDLCDYFNHYFEEIEKYLKAFLAINENNNQLKFKNDLIKSDAINEIKRINNNLLLLNGKEALYLYSIQNHKYISFKDDICKDIIKFNIDRQNIIFLLHKEISIAQLNQVYFNKDFDLNNINNHVFNLYSLFSEKNFISLKLKLSGFFNKFSAECNDITCFEIENYNKDEGRVIIYDNFILYFYKYNLKQHIISCYYKYPFKCICYKLIKYNYNNVKINALVIVTKNKIYLFDADNLTDMGEFKNDYVNYFNKLEKNISITQINNDEILISIYDIIFIYQLKDLKPRIIIENKFGLIRNTFILMDGTIIICGKIISKRFSPKTFEEIGNFYEEYSFDSLYIYDNDYYFDDYDLDEYSHDAILPKSISDIIQISEDTIIIKIGKYYEIKEIKI